MEQNSFPPDKATPPAPGTTSVNLPFELTTLSPITAPPFNQASPSTAANFKAHEDSPTESPPQVVPGYWNTGMDNSQQAILSEEALILHTKDLFDLPSEYYNEDFAYQNNGESSSRPNGNNEEAVQDEQEDAGVPSLGSPTSYVSIYGDRFKDSKDKPSNNKTASQPTNTFSQGGIKRPRSPTMLEAAAMAADILANENATGTTKKARPCDSCRRRKARCIMLPSDTGRCLHCEVKKQACTFLEAPVRRNRTKKNSVSQPPHALPPMQPPSSSADLEGSLGEVEGERRMSNEHAAAPRLRYEDYASLGGHTLLKKALSLQYPRSSYYIGPTSVFDTKLLEATPLDNQGRALLAGDIELRKVSNDVMFSLKNDYSEALYERSIQNVDAVEQIVAPHGRTLIDLYFRIVHPCFPILHKKVFLEKYKRTHREFMAPLLAAVYILALNWWNYDPALAVLPRPDVDALFKLGMHTFSDALDRPKLSSVQAGLLLLQCQPNHNRSWMLCSQVVAVTEELGIGLDSGKWRLPQWERGLRRRLAWAVWLQDKWLSLSEARPSHIDRLRTWHIKHVNADDFPERHEMDQEGSAEVETGRVLFMEFIKLTEIIEDMTDNLFTVRSVRLLVQTEKILEEIKPLQIRLRNWYHNLPPQLGMNVSRPRKLSSNGYLHLAYFATEITLHRRIIKSLTDKSPPALLNICREAAKQRLVAAMDFVRNLRPEHLQAFWYSSSANSFALIGSFAALLHVTAKDPEEAAMYKAKVRDYRWVLRVSASGFEPMAEAMRLLDIALCRVPQLLDDELDPNDPNHAFGPATSARTTSHIHDDDVVGDGVEDFSNETPPYDGPADERMDDKTQVDFSAVSTSPGSVPGPVASSEAGISSVPASAGPASAGPTSVGPDSAGPASVGTVPEASPAPSPNSVLPISQGPTPTAEPSTEVPKEHTTDQIPAAKKIKTEP